MEKKREDPKPPTISSDATPPSVSPADLTFPVSFGLVISCRLGDVERIRTLIHDDPYSGGRIVFQTVSEGDLYLLREAQVTKALKGDVSALAEIHNKKRRSVEI